MSTVYNPWCSRLAVQDLLPNVHDELKRDVGLVPLILKVQRSRSLWVPTSNQPWGFTVRWWSLSTWTLPLLWPLLGSWEQFQQGFISICVFLKKVLNQSPRGHKSWLCPCTVWTRGSQRHLLGAVGRWLPALHSTLLCSSQQFLPTPLAVALLGKWKSLLPQDLGLVWSHTALWERCTKTMTVLSPAVSLAPGPQICVLYNLPKDTPPSI